MGHLFERHVLGQIGDDVAPVDEAPVGAVDHADLGAGGDHALEPGDVLGAHRLASGKGLCPGSGPIHTDAGRMMRRSCSASNTWAVQPATREVAKMQGNSAL